jgi:hypothetical protein
MHCWSLMHIMHLINARNKEQSKHCVLFQGTTQNLRMSVKETPKISFVVVIVAEEVTIKHGIFQNRIRNVYFTPTCSKGRRGPCVESS